METFDCELKQQVIYGDNTIERLGELTRSLGGSRVLVTTDPGIEKAGILARAVSALQSERIAAYVYADVTPNPTTEAVEAAVTVAKTNAPIDLIIGLGGGSSMDCAKGANFLLTNGGKMADYWGTDKATERCCPPSGSRRLLAPVARHNLSLSSHNQKRISKWRVAIKRHVSVPSF